MRRHKQLPPLSLKFRTFGVMSASAMASAKGLDQHHCDLCGQACSGVRHFALSCSGLNSIRDDQQFACKGEVSEFTLCTGIPETTFWYTPPQPYRPKPQPVLFPCKTSFFTDGSADPSNLPNVRLSSWSVVQSETMGMVSEVISGIMPGPLHNILRAETFALLQVLRLCCEADIYIDNSTVVLYANDMIRNGFRPALWESKADGDLWALIASELVLRSPDSIHVYKVKAHMAFEEAANSFQQWLVTGNAAADKLAKRALASHVEDNNLQDRTTQESTQIDDAFRCPETSSIILADTRGCEGKTRLSSRAPIVLGCWSFQRGKGSGQTLASPNADL